MRHMPVPGIARRIHVAARQVCVLIVDEDDDSLSYSPSLPGRNTPPHPTMQEAKK
jgi:hypothetical protein